jgi:L-lactate dehydrogenase complex protein LldF
MTTDFRARIRRSLTNNNLQAALDINAERRVTRRINALAALPDWKERRQQAHAIRAEVIEHLDEYLDQFIATAKSNGVIVHRAQDSAEAVKIVLEISKSLPPGDENILVAKSKSMVSEEIDLNHALEKENPSTGSERRIRVVETDLGEYIVQLRNERPSHIISPALHLRRQDVGELFHEKLGIPYTEDIPTLTNTARKELRKVFLTADVGISGANFAVAETGSICLVTID